MLWLEHFNHYISTVLWCAFCFHFFAACGRHYINIIDIALLALWNFHIGNSLHEVKRYISFEHRLHHYIHNENAYVHICAIDCVPINIIIMLNVVGKTPILLNNVYLVWLYETYHWIRLLIFCHRQTYYWDYFDSRLDIWGTTKCNISFWMLRKYKSGQFDITKGSNFQKYVIVDYIRYV